MDRNGSNKFLRSYFHRNNDWQFICMKDVMPVRARGTVAYSTLVPILPLS